MRKQFITVVILAALLVTGCAAEAGDTAVTAAETEAAAASVAAETAGEELSEEEKSEKVASDSTMEAEADEADNDEAEAEDEEADAETEKTEDEEAEAEESESEVEDEDAESEAETEDSEDEVDDEEEESEEEAESEDEEEESDETEADDVTAAESEGTPRIYSGRSRSAEKEDKEADAESAEETESEDEEEENELEDEEEESEEEDAEAKDEEAEDVTAAKSEGAPGTYSGRPRPSGRPSERAGESGRGKSRDEEYEAFWDEIFPDLEDGEGEYDNFWDVFPDVFDGEYDNFWEMFPDLDIDEEPESDEEAGSGHSRGSDERRPEAPAKEPGRDELPGHEESAGHNKESDRKDEKAGKEHEEETTKKAEPEFEESEGLAFKSNKDGTCTVTGIGTCDDTVIVIPQKSPKGDTVAAIGEGAFDHAKGIEGVVFKDLVIEIERGAFTGSSIESIEVYGSSLVINEDAFSKTADLSYFAADESEIVADPYSFDSAFDGADLVFTDSTLIFDDASFVYSGISSMIGRDSTFFIGEDAFDYCEDLQTMEFTDCYVDIGAYAFFCSGDEMELLFELSDVTIGEDAFAFSDIINLEIDASTVQIGEDAFDYCDAVEAIIIRASIVETEPYAFYGCGNQAKVVFQNGEVTLGKDAFAFADIASLKIVKCDVEIGPEAFKSCSSLRRVDIGSGNINIGKRAFYHCEELREITLGENGQGPHSIVIGENAFEFSGLDKVMIGKGSVEIGSGAFKYCENLRDVKVRGAIEKIGRNAFFRCDDELIIHYGGEDYDAKTIQDVVSTLADDDVQPNLRKDARSRTILRASFDGSSFGDTYQVGEVWNVPGQWKITIDSVCETTERSEASEHEPAAVYVIDYTYENTGYKGVNGASEGLYLSLSSAGIEDSQGTSGYIYPGSVTAAPTRISKGESCKAQGRVGVDNPGNFTITFKMTDGNRESQQASFVIDISNIIQLPDAPPEEAQAQEAAAEAAAAEDTPVETPESEAA